MSLALGNMRASVHGCTEMWSAECGVQTFQDFSAHATGFSQWLMTNFPERRIYSAKISGGRIS
jgi:hypothetical protein